VKKNSTLIGLGLLIVMLFAGNAAHFFQINLIDKLSSSLYDQRLQLTMPGGIDERIVILDIDEKSLREEGRWPWNRNRLALLVEQLFDKYEIDVLGFDMVFAEKDTSSGIGILEQLGNNQLRSDPEFQNILTNIRPQLDYDKLFADQIKDRKVVLGYYLTNQKFKQHSGMLPAPTFPAGQFGDRPLTISSWNGYGANLPELQQAAAGAGHFNSLEDADGVIRRVPLLAEYAGAYYESLPVAIVRTMQEPTPGSTHPSSRLSDASVPVNTDAELLELKQLKIPLDANMAALVPYRGKQGSFRYISASDVLYGRVTLAQLKGKIVLVGTTAPGLLDLRATPVESAYPGVEIHANMIAGILDQSLKAFPAYMHNVELLWLLLTGIIFSLMMPYLYPARAIRTTLLILTLTIGISFYLWQYENLFLPVTSSLIMTLMLFSLKMSYGYFIESSHKRQITRMFEQYVPPEVVSKMRKNAGIISMKGESREMTVLFSDVRGFSHISESMSSDELALLMNAFLTPLSRVVHQHNGTIDKYMGDCIMAFWGAPLPDEHHARHAILAGLEMLSSVAGLQASFRERGWPEINIGVGLNSGRVSVGNMGSKLRVAYTVIGDEVNLASRLEGLTKQYGIGMIVGENTHALVTDFYYRNIDDVRVKGRDKPVTIYQPLGLISEVSKTLQAEVELFHEVRKLYRAQEWDSAESLLKKLQQNAPDTRLYEIYTERIANFRSKPPAADWDGVYDYQEK